MNPQQRPDPREISELRATIQTFLAERLAGRLEKTQDPAQRQALIDSHQLAVWLEDAARRVKQIQQATHAIKYSHPEARGSNLLSQGNPDVPDTLIGTHTLADGVVVDVVGNAAMLDVYKFLRLDVGGHSLLDRAIAADPALHEAFDHERAGDWSAAFASLPQPRGEPTSHTLAKQVYWPLGGGQYHLLVPLFSSTLAHRLWTTVREDRFSPEARAAREARRERRPHPHGFCEYPEFAIQKFGGTKTQNISQLNSERHGENILLASCPPNWRGAAIRPLLQAESLFERRFPRRPAVRELTETLRRFLYGVQERNNLGIRERRAELIGLIRDELIQCVAELHTLPSGWTCHAECRLPPHEQYWLDPGRGANEPDFDQARRQTDWQTEICRRFGTWLNRALASKHTPMGDPEYREWHGVLEAELRLLREDLETDD